MADGCLLDLEGWARRAQYEFFKDYELPFFNLCAEVEVGATRAWCREAGVSFSLACWFACQQTVNELEQFRYRLRPSGVWAHDRVEVATTILNDDETFRFCYLPYGEAFADFTREAKLAMSTPPEGIDDRPENDAVIHGTTLPWLRFTSVSHPRRMRPEDSTPKITLGKVSQADGALRMPVSVEVHHALMDGIHACRFFEVFARYLADPLSTYSPEPTVAQPPLETNG